MAKRPDGDLGAMALTKAMAANAQPFKPVPPPAPPAPAGLPAAGPDTSLTVKVDAATYASLRAYCYGQEQASGKRVSHQAVAKQALVAFLEASRG